MPVPRSVPALAVVVAAPALVALVVVLVAVGAASVGDLVVLVAVLAVGAVLWRQTTRRARVDRGEAQALSADLRGLEAQVRAVDALVRDVVSDVAGLTDGAATVAAAVESLVARRVDEDLARVVDRTGLVAAVANLESHAVVLQEHLDAVTSALHDARPSPADPGGHAAHLAPPTRPRTGGPDPT